MRWSPYSDIRARTPHPKDVDQFDINILSKVSENQHIEASRAWGALYYIHYWQLIPHVSDKMRGTEVSS